MPEGEIILPREIIRLNNRSRLLDYKLQNLPTLNGTTPLNRISEYLEDIYKGVLGLPSNMNPAVEWKYKPTFFNFKIQGVSQEDLLLTGVNIYHFEGDPTPAITGNLRNGETPIVAPHLFDPETRRRASALAEIASPRLLPFQLDLLSSLVEFVSTQPSRT